MSETGEEPVDEMGSSPTQIADPVMRREAKKAFVWTLVIGGVALAVYLSQSLLVILGGVILAAMIDGGARLLGRYLHIGRTWRVAIVLLATLAFFIWLAMFAGQQISRQAAEFPALVTAQINELIGWLRGNGLAVEAVELQSVFSNLASGVGTITRAIGGILGGFTTGFLILILGIFIAIEPDIYERGVEWMLPKHLRENFRITGARMGRTLRHLLAGRLVGMLIEGVFTWAMLAYGGLVIGVGTVPMAALLGLLTGLLAFIPNIGAVISGLLMVLVGFSGGTDMGIYTIFVYFFVQTIDGYLLVPMIAKKTVDLAPALVLAAQLILGVLFGILGLALADPLLAMAKVALERRAEQNDAAHAAKTAKA
jgi:predicted PurR-regulated permease PerM